MKINKKGGLLSLIGIVVIVFIALAVFAKLKYEDNFCTSNYEETLSEYADDDNEHYSIEDNSCCVKYKTINLSTGELMDKKYCVVIVQGSTIDEE